MARQQAAATSWVQRIGPNCQRSQSAGPTLRIGARTRTHVAADQPSVSAPGCARPRRRPTFGRCPDQCLSVSGIMNPSPGLKGRYPAPLDERAVPKGLRPEAGGLREESKYSVPQASGLKPHSFSSGPGGARILVCGFSGHRRAPAAGWSRLSYRPVLFAPPCLGGIRLRKKARCPCDTEPFRAFRPPERPSVTSAEDGRGYSRRAVFVGKTLYLAARSIPSLCVLGSNSVVKTT
jgi:hypothetical protein